MKASTEKSSSTASKTTASRPFFAKASGGDFFAPVNRAAVPAVQAKMTVGKTGDKFEREADRMADKVMRMPSPAASAKEEKIQRKADERLQKAAKSEEKIQKKEKQEEKIQKAPAGDDKLRRKGEGTLIVTPNVQAAIRSKASGGGQPLSADVRRDMEGRFNADFSQVRVHSDAEAGKLSNQLSARAFTHRNHIFFSRNQYQPGSSGGKQLLAHELTHTIQQGHAVQRSPQVSTTTTPPVVQRWSWPKLEWPDIPNPIEYLINKAKETISEKAESIYGFPMLTVIIGRNPITGATVDRSPGNLLKAAIDLIPGGDSINQALENHKVFDKVSAFAAKQFDALKNIGSNIWQDIKNFLTSFSKEDLLNLGKAFDTAKGVINVRIEQIKNFAIGLKNDIVELIKDLILKPLAAFIKENSPNGYDLLCAVLGKDPISGEPVPQTAENLIGPFMKLIGEEEVWNKMQQAKAIPRAWAWFQKAMATVKGYVTQIPDLAIKAFKSLVIADIVLLPNAFNKIKSVFGSFVVNFITWAGTAVWNLLEIIFDVVKPGALEYIKKTGSALKGILKNPMPFVGNLVKAAKQGFLNFSDNIGAHLKASLIDWLVGSLQGAGVYIPKALNLAEMGKFALSVLGITWAGIRKKIVKALGDKGETIVGGIEKGLEWAAKGFEIVRKLMDGGIDAAWEMIKEKLADLKDTVVEGIKGFVVDTIVTKAVPKLVGMFIPGAGFLLAIKSIYDTIMVFVKKISEIIQVVTAFVDSIVTIAAGNITAAASRVEKILGGMLSLALNFLAGFLGLGKISDKIKNVIDKIRDKVDKAIDKAIEWIVTKAKELFGKLFGGKEKQGAKDHKGMAKEAKKKLIDMKLPVESTSQAKKDMMQTEASKISIEYTGKLTPPVKMTIKFVDPPDAKKDQEIDFQVRIAPNDANEKGSKSISEDNDYNVGEHKVEAPNKNQEGESHHVPVKVLKNWIGEILVVAGEETDNSTLKDRGTAMIKDKVGNNLSAIWLSKKNHDVTHQPSTAKPSEFESEKNDIIVHTRTGIVSQRPFRSTIANSVYSTEFNQDESNSATKKKMNEEIYKKFSRKLKKLFTRVHAGLLKTGIAGVDKANLKDTKWKSKLKDSAIHTWEKKLDPDATDSN